MRFLLKIAFAAILGVSVPSLTKPVQAQSKWNITQLDAAQYPAEIVEETRSPADEGLVDGLIDTSSTGDIVAAWYSKPTERYKHGILGDTIEAGQLNVRTAKNRDYKIRLPRTEVFEDQTPRLADLDGDGSIEVVTIRSSMAKGAAMTIYGLSGNSLKEKASTAFYGKKYRWLNIAGIASFLGTRFKEIAFVETPHIGGVLYFYRYANGLLLKISGADNFSNHVIDSREMRLSAVSDLNSDGKSELALPSADRKTLRIMGFNGRYLKNLAAAKLPAEIDKAIAVKTGDEKGYVVGLENGDVYLVHP